MTGLYHVCFTVPDLEAAMRDLTTAAAVGWQKPVKARIGEWEYRIVFTTGGAPFIELIEAAPGGPWGDTSEPGFHHIGFWTSNIEAGTERLTANGMPEEFSGCPYGRPFAYHRVPGIGANLELVEITRQPSFIDAWNPGGDPMPAINEEAYPWNASR
ncbi:VOC family protein [Streptomyces sp. NPDC000229]|uniref:VOC family protein n=1 Tax=Streptomyces sp. NPDC000229 TaxID=3154247 RepID=UPI00333076D0